MEYTRSSRGDRNRAILLLGPTGSGKTPLGAIIRQRGLWGTPCLHFDFGANLRQVVEGDWAGGNWPDELIGRADRELLWEVLRCGALLEDAQFPIARRILRAFMARGGAEEDTWIVLNGLPRHAGQAREINRILDIKVVVYLRCSSETVLARIGADFGGDRAGRADDDLQSVRRKLLIFEQRSAPLVQHYLRQGVSVETIQVTAGMTAERMWEMLDKTAAFAEKGTGPIRAERAAGPADEFGRHPFRLRGG